MFLTDVRLAFAPSATYRQLISQNSPMRWWRALTRPALVLLLLSVVVPMMVTNVITARLVLSSAIAWGLVVAIQLAIAAVLVAPARASEIGFWRAMDLWFAGHVPYSLWILLLPFLTNSFAVPPHDVMGLSFLVPLAWTSVITNAFFQMVLGMDPSTARRRASLHLVIVVVVASAFVLWASGGFWASASYIMQRLNALSS
jgi:hypothetical protein